MAYRNFKDLSRRKTSEKELWVKPNIAKNLKHDRCQCRLASLIYKFFHKKSSGTNTSGAAFKSKIMLNQQLDDELHKPIIRTFEKRKVHSFKGKIKVQICKWKVIIVKWFDFYYASLMFLVNIYI